MLFLKIFYLFIFREEEERERNINVWLPLTHPLQGTWPTTQAWELNQQPFGSQVGFQSTEPHQLGLLFIFNRALLMMSICV